MTKINHLNGVHSRFLETERLRMHVLTAGSPGRTPILFLHGNASSSTIWEELMLRFSEDYFCVAPDLRGFGQTEETLIDATRGIADWAADLKALIEKMNLAPFHLVGHSLGGFVCWGMIGSSAPDIRTATLLAPGPPMGFGGIQGERGLPSNPDYSGSGGGIVAGQFVNRIKVGDRSADDPLYSPRNTMNRLFWKEGFSAEREEDILTAMLNIHTGDKKYPGDYVVSDYWPGTAPGKFGPVNALSPKYNRDLIQLFLQADPKPPLLWIHGKDDMIISDQSFSDPGYQGKLGLRDGWPGPEAYPQQPMVSQIRYALQRYEKLGGKTSEKWIDDCGHSPFIEKPEEVFRHIYTHITKI